MTILLDTGPLVAFFNQDDPLHPRADALMENALLGQWGLPLSTDFVLDEGVTLLRRRPAKRALSEAFAGLLLPSKDRTPQVQLLSTTREQLQEAWQLHLQHYDRGLSFTDCTLLVHARSTGSVLATFDGAFDGLVPLAKS